MKALTIRLSDSLYAQSRELAKKRHISVNALIQQSLEEFAHSEKERMLYDAFTLVGEETREANAEYALPAQSEVLQHED
ncbi:MAG: hypothetical protein ACYDBB_13110 [Armatimonadota bacterium]